MSECLVGVYQEDIPFDTFRLDASCIIYKEPDRGTGRQDHTQIFLGTVKSTHMGSITVSVTDRLDIKTRLFGTLPVVLRPTPLDLDNEIETKPFKVRSDHWLILEDTPSVRALMSLYIFASQREVKSEIRFRKKVQSIRNILNSK